MNWNTLPPYFTQDSIARGVFKPATDEYATVPQLKVLLADAEFYAEGATDCAPQLTASARAVVRALTRILNIQPKGIRP